MSSIDTLLPRMTLAEKIGQLNMGTGDHAVTGPELAADLIEGIRAGTVGSILNFWGAEPIAALQKIAVEESRLGIPLLVGFDVLHGQRTIFPIPLAEAAAFDPPLWERTARAAAVEAARDGIALTFAPMLDIARDPRWGRIAEGAGEDPWVAARFAEAKVRGFQGASLAEAGSVAATAKHFCAYGAAFAGLDYGPVDMSDRLLHEIYLPPFAAAVAAGCAAIMPSFNDLSGVPMTAHKALLWDWLRARHGFEGVIVSDYNAIAELVRHGVAADLAEAAALALAAGVDIDMVGNAYLSGLPVALERGLVTIEAIDAAVRRVLVLKQRLGLFDDPYRRGATRAEAAGAGKEHFPGNEAPLRIAKMRHGEDAEPLSETVWKSNLHRASLVLGDREAIVSKGEGPVGQCLSSFETGPADPPQDEGGAFPNGFSDWLESESARTRCNLARDAARRSIVLLTNDGVLPLAAELRRIALVGPLADAPAEMLGPWHAGGDPVEAIGIRAGLAAALPDCEIACAEGVAIADDDTTGIAAALEAASCADLVVLCIGEAADMSGEAACRADPGLPGRQNALARALFEVGKPVVVLVSSGRPLMIPMIVERANAVLATWFLGGEAGPAIADVLTGRFNPVGRLPVTWPRHIGQVPIFYATRPSGRPADPGNPYSSKYLDIPTEPQFCFGHGHSYTRFALSNLRAGSSAFRLGDTIAVEVDVTNTGSCFGEETIFLFARDVVASVARPVRELVGFSRIALSPGETGTVTFALAAASLCCLGPDLEPRLEPGDFVLSVGPSADPAGLLSLPLRAARD
jgi:beta-glucosidase-like glycosyl hydrolase